jgi:glycosyltransferase involved in cell wall biosynthesis
MSNRQQQTNKLKEKLRQKLEDKNINTSNNKNTNSKTTNSKRGVKKICLTMIVKNEAKNMVRLLNSLIGVIDMISIVDTGSTDDTKKIIYDWGKEHNIATKVHNEPFKNFAYNRTHSIQKAKETYKDADYFLLSDADFIWEKDIGVKFDKVLLVDHKYLVEQYNKMLRYWNIRLLSAKVDWECVGVTHEYWKECAKQSEYTGDIRISKISTLAINDQEDGGCKTDKFTRDEKLLKEGLEDKETPDDLKTRYKFYLAQTLKDMSRFDESIEWYKKRIDDGGWAEEVYHSKFQLGVCNEQLGWHKKRTAELLGKEERKKEEDEYIKKWNSNEMSVGELLESANENFTKAGESYLDAYNHRNTRAEALYNMTKMYRMLGLNDMAYKYAVIGNTIKYPKDDTLFIEKACYDFLFDLELSIISFYIPGEKDIGRQATSRLLTNENLPEHIYKMVEANSRHYI